MPISGNEPRKELSFVCMTCIYCGDAFTVGHPDMEVAESAAKMALQFHLDTKHKDKLN